MSPNLISDLEREQETIWRTREQILTRDGKKVLPEYMGSEEKLRFFDLFLKYGFYTNARFLADSLLQENVPITSLRYHAYTHFQELEHQNRAGDRLVLALLFEEEYLFHLWLDDSETRQFKQLKQQTP